MTDQGDLSAKKIAGIGLRRGPGQRGRTLVREASPRGIDDRSAMGVQQDDAFSTLGANAGGGLKQAYEPIDIV